MSRPNPNTYSPFMQNYIDSVKGNTIAEIITNHHQELLDFYLSIPENFADYRYAEGKWTVKDVLMHVIDTDIVFGYRALAISRGESQILNGFDQDQYVQNAETSLQSFVFLKEMFKAQRESTKFLISSFSEKQLNRIGKVSDYELSVNAACFVLFCHALHHMRILKERYLTI